VVVNAHNSFTERFGIQPIIQAPMAGVSTSQLAAAVSNAGGLGSLGIGASSVAQAQQLISETRLLTNAPFNVNVFCHAPAQRDAIKEHAWLTHLADLFAECGAKVPTQIDEIYTSFIEDEAMFNMLLNERPAVVSFHFGLPSGEKISALKQAGIYTIATATNLQEAQYIELAGIDAIVAQGVEAGGHRGMFNPAIIDELLSTSELVRLLVQQTQLPVIAAGGIMDGQGIKAALDLGAVAAQLGTAFILCPESAANFSYRENLKSELASVTKLTSVLSGRPARGIVNRFIIHGESDDAPTPAAYPVAYDAAKRLNAMAIKLNNHNFAAQWAGQGAPLAREMSAEKLIHTLVNELYLTES
jgi:nitronate monooxygenase